MKRLTYLVGLAALLWAQQIQVEGLKLKLDKLPSRWRPMTLKGNQARVQSLPWLLPNQDYIIVPTSPATQPDYAGDTLISNGVGPNTRQNPPAACVGTFFDSLDVALAFLAENNERFVIAGISSPLAVVTDGTIAERYDFSPDLGGTNRTVSIKGIAVMLVNIHSSNSNACDPALPAPARDSLNDGGYTFFYQLYPVRTYTWGQPFYSQPRPGTILGAAPVRSASKTADQIRLANGLYGQNGSQCPPVSPTTNVVEVFDFVYFSNPLDITDTASYYVVVGTERYNLKSYNLTDTIYFLLGPAFSNFWTTGNLDAHPCFTGDTVLIGRSLFSIAIYDTASGNFFGRLSSLNPTLPDWVPTHAINSPIKNGLNWVAFPIVYAQNDLTTGIWMHGDAQSIMTPYPNPTTDCFHLHFESQQPTTVRLYLYTTDGRLVKTWEPQPISAGKARVVVDVNDVPAGTYLLRVQSELGRAAFHVTVLH
ncbi:MAG: T9SS type A sorting domain-containing protein [Bacteroidia bacterium]|nr:T9SS type A sorting domain-containing protein [Bacteroidia bacterium]